MLDAAIDGLRRQAGIADVADLGVVHSSMVGHARCDVSVGIESVQGTFYLRIVCVHHRGTAFRRTRVVKWPYSRSEPRDLDAALHDLRVVRDGPSSRFVDDRSGVGRLVDRLIGRHFLGTFRFGSAIRVKPAIEVTAGLSGAGADAVVALTEKTPGRGWLMAHVPHSAFAGICNALDGYRQSP